MTDGNDRITADDIAELNRTARRRTASIARQVGVALMIVAGLGVLAWLWIVVRQQQVVGARLTPSSFGAGRDPSSLERIERIDRLVGSFGLLLSAGLLGGVGFAVRLLADFLYSREGGSLVPAEVGEVAPNWEDDDTTDPEDHAP